MSNLFLCRYFHSKCGHTSNSIINNISVHIYEYTLFTFQHSIRLYLVLFIPFINHDIVSFLKRQVKLFFALSYFIVQRGNHEQSMKSFSLSAVGQFPSPAEDVEMSCVFQHSLFVFFIKAHQT